MSLNPSSSSTTLVQKPYPRLWNITGGRWMVVTDLHGDGQLYQQYRARFVELFESQQVDGLIILGDLIHRDPSHGEDDSVNMVLDVIELQHQYGERVIYLCGNHELPHIYTFPLSKGNIEYTPEFEKALVATGRRKLITTYFMQLPFYLRTAAGVTLTHAGAFKNATEPENMHKLYNWSHQDVIQQAEYIMEIYHEDALRYGYARLMRSDSYRPMAQKYIGADPTSPHYDHLVRGLLAMKGFSFELAYFVGEFTQNYLTYNRNNATQTAEEFQILWDALFTKCERQLPSYARFLRAILRNLSDGYVHQNWLVTGHIDMHEPYVVVQEQQFRFASGKHAKQQADARYLILDAATPPQSAVDLAAGLANIYQPATLR